MTPETSPAQGTLKRLLESERQAQEILQSAEERARDTIAQAREQAARSVEAVRVEAAGLLHSQLDEVQSKAAAEVKQRLDQAETDAREFERCARGHVSEAVEMVVDWVTAKGGLM